MSDRPLNEHDILTCCALRFDGYKYQNDHPDVVPGKVVDEFFSTGCWNALDMELLASFFFLQRALYKWELVSEPRDGQYWQAFRSLFLRLQDVEIPERYQLQAYCQQWEQQYCPHHEACVMQIKATYEGIRSRG